MNDSKKIIDLYYFSGTGNTLLVAESFAGHISQLGYTTNLIQMERSSPEQIDRGHIIGLAFPVAMSTFPFVWDFIHGLPRTSGTEVFILATMAGGSVGLVGRLKTVLLRKGFTPLGAHQVRMPANIFFVQDEDSNERLRGEGIASAELFAEKIVAGTANWPCIPIVSDIAYLLYLLVISSWKIKLHQKIFRYIVDESKCIKCGLCSRLCPVDNISLDSLPRFGLKCQYCMRCISFCPVHAIKSKFLYKNRTYKAVAEPFTEGKKR
jgi:NAD-dependent dihydropyrimidine dehydrogenase PreA subunit